ncbi:MAG: hypothetical protein AAGG50_03825 [Bacteroidota bacterium]
MSDEIRLSPDFHAAYGERFRAHQAEIKQLEADAHAYARDLARSQRAVKKSYLDTIREAGADAYGDVTKFAEAIADEAAISVDAARNGLYKVRSQTVVDTAVRLLGFEPNPQPANVAA